MVLLKAIEAGVDIVDTALSPLGNGTSQPATEPLVATLAGTKYDTGLDLNLLTDISKHFKTVAERLKKDGFLDPKVLSIDINTLLYQVPGGMLSNLMNQLKQMNASDKLMDVLQEVPRVREDFGYPPLVTPTSQIVGTQAVLNVVSGQRYKTFTKESRGLLRGEYGRLPAPVNEDVRKKAHRRPGSHHLPPGGPARARNREVPPGVPPVRQERRGRPVLRAVPAGGGEVLPVPPGPRQRHRLHGARRRDPSRLSDPSPARPSLARGIFLCPRRGAFPDGEGPRPSPSGNRSGDKPRSRRVWGRAAHKGGRSRTPRAKTSSARGVRRGRGGSAPSRSPDPAWGSVCAFSLEKRGGTEMKILLTNDDGYGAPGIEALRIALQAAGHEVTVVAPSEQRSGAGHSVTLRRELRAKPRPHGYALDGTPADCAKIGLRFLAPGCDMVLSGINLGANLGVDTNYSGTAAAAREAAIQGVPALASSCWGKEFRDADYLAELTVCCAEALWERPLPEGTFLNLNLPNVQRGTPVPFAAAPLSWFTYAEEFVEGDSQGEERIFTPRYSADKRARGRVLRPGPGRPGLCGSDARVLGRHRPAGPRPRPGDRAQAQLTEDKIGGKAARRGCSALREPEMPGKMKDSGNRLAFSSFCGTIDGTTPTEDGDYGTAAGTARENQPDWAQALQGAKAHRRIHRQPLRQGGLHDGLAPGRKGPGLREHGGALCHRLGVRTATPPCRRLCRR